MPKLYFTAADAQMLGTQRGLVSVSYRRGRELISVAPRGQDVECEGRLITDKCQQSGMSEKVETTDYTFWTNPINASPSHSCVLLGHEKTEIQNNDAFLQSSICHQLRRGKKSALVLN